MQKYKTDSIQLQHRENFFKFYISNFKFNSVKLIRITQSLHIKHTYIK